VVTLRGHLLQTKHEARKSTHKIFHLTHLGMASGCGSRAPHLDTAFMDSPLVLTSELRPPAASKRTASNLFRSVETREERGSYGTSGALLTYFHLDVDLVLRNEPREALSMGADVQKEPTSPRKKKKMRVESNLAFFYEKDETPLIKNKGQRRIWMHWFPILRMKVRLLGSLPG
jgi:hypothetical protein